MSREMGLLELASSISDYVPLNWRQIESGYADTRQRVMQLHLKTISAIAELHHTFPVDDEALEQWGQLEIRQKIGQGAFGEVYRAWDPMLHRDVALKLLSGTNGRGELAIKEARSMARVRHTNVIVVHGVDRKGDRVGLWMDLIRGRTVESILQDQGPLGGHEAALIGIDLCRALAAVHGANLIHGDLKAHNVMREEGGRIILMDFGLVRENTFEAPNQYLQSGTPAYMAPELRRGEKPSVSSDIFALGVLLYHLVTGAYPYSGQFSGTSGYAERAKLLHDCRPDLQEHFIQTIERALARNPADRFETAGEMLNALLTSLGTGIVHPKEPEKTAKPFLKWPWFRLTAFAAGLVVLFLLVAVVASRGVRLSIKNGIPAVTSTVSRQASIAVLPFANLNGDPEMDYLSEGVADQLTSRLTKVKGLMVVVARSPVERNSPSPDVLKVANELNVATLLTGSIRKLGDHIRISVQLIDPNTNSYLWSETYDREIKSIFSLQDEISRAVVARLNAQFAGIQMVDTVSHQTGNVEAYHLYLKGRFHWNKRNPEEMKKAIGYFQQAVALDPTYALAYSGLADCYSTLVNFGALPAQQAMPLAKQAALKARDLDESLAEAHTSLGFISSVYDWDWATAERSFKRAIQLNPSYSTAHAWYARFLLQTDQVSAAIDEAKRAEDLDPLSVPVNLALGSYLYFARKYDEAEGQLKKTLDLDSTFMPAHFYEGRVDIRKGKLADAFAESARIGNLAEGKQLSQLLAAEAYGVSGRRAEALNIVHEWERARSQGASVPASFLATVYSTLGDKALALEWLNKAYDERDSSLFAAQRHPSYDWLHSDPEFIAIFKRVGLPYRPL